MSEKLFFPASFFTVKPTLQNIFNIVGSELFNKTLLAFTMQTIFSIIIFGCLAIPFGCGLSKSYKNKKAWIIAGIITAFILPFCAITLLHIKTYFQVTLLTAILSPCLILAGLIVANGIINKKLVPGIIGGTTVTLFGSYPFCIYNSHN